MGGFSLETLGSREHIMFYLQRKKQACKLGEGEINCRGGKQAGEGGNKPEGEVKTSQNFLRPCWVLRLHKSSHVNIRDSMMS